MNGLPTDTQLEQVHDDLLLLTDHQFPSIWDVLPVLPGQYLFAPEQGEVELWKLTTSGWFDASGVHYESPLVRNPKLTQWQRAELGAR